MKIIAKICLFSLSLLCTMLYADDVQTRHEVRLEVNLLCPSSAELQSLIDAIPKAEDQSSNFDTWSQDFVLNMQKMIELVQSGKIGDGSFSIDVEDNQPDPTPSPTPSQQITLSVE